VFEWVTDKLGSQGTVCAGGRYDSLVEQLGGKQATAIGFAIGLERLISLLEATESLPEITQIDAYLVAIGEKAMAQAPILSEKLRDEIPSIKLISHCGGGSFKSQFKRADRSGARWTLILAEDEVNNQTIGIKTMATGEQETIPWDQLPAFLRQ
ncbi:hypothetical protein LCGC14_0731520, partial [marine sediment metagenome]